jgi:4-amino-4-deoxy-L-arabinose transferase-like glycosyltransferase
MRDSLVQRLGLLGAGYDARLVWSIVFLCVALYALSYALFYPRVLTNSDEGRYVGQTQALLETGSIVLHKGQPLTGETEDFVPGDYPIGMVALMAPFVRVFGWQGAFLPSFLCLLLAGLATAWWLKEEGRSPIFALILFGFPAILVGGRLAMSDVARTAAAALGTALLFHGLDRPDSRVRWWLGSGLVAGASLSLRETTVLPFVPLFMGTVLRWDRGWWWLVVGGLAGYPFDANLLDRLPLYLIGLLVFVPGGLAFSLAYRGRRRVEVVSTIAVYFLFYLFQQYGMNESGTVKRAVVALRYFAPLLPLIAFAMAESLPRWLGWLSARQRDRSRFDAAAGAVAALWIGGVLLVTAIVHPTMDRWSSTQAEIRDAIAHGAPDDTVLIGNGVAVEKFIDAQARKYVLLNRSDLSRSDLDRLLERHGVFLVAFLDRSDSAFWRADAAENAAFVADLPEPVELVVDLEATQTDHLRVWRVGRGAAAPARASAP